MSRFFAISAGVIALAGLGVGAAAMVRSVERDVRTPLDLAGIPYATSKECVVCHPSRYDSWRRTFHRTMTQVASPAAVVGNFDNASYTYEGVTSRFTREGEHYFIETLNGARRMERFEVAMTVGSRRFQQYVTSIGGRHFRLPLAWNIEEKRWFHLNGGFLHPDGSDFNTHLSLWDANCIFCHNVKPQPRFDTRTEAFDPHVAEFGIACEACHGPGAEHEKRNANPIRRYALYLGHRDPTIHSPREMPTARQTQLCGHCHGQRVPNPTSRIAELMMVGDPYTAGEDLSQYATPVSIHTELEGADFVHRFWKDGTPRLTAFEYQGLLMSAGHENTKLTCISCHTMHGGDPRGMIRAEMRGNTGCLQCHGKLAADVPAHTKHAAASTGSNCYACHMPSITYGLLEMHPTHRILNPEPARAWRHEMPEACTLCHTNQTATWAALATSRQYGESPPADLPTDARFRVAESVRALLGGDVVQRAAAASALAADASYTDDAMARLWAVPFLLVAMDDRYPAIRHFAWRGVGRLVGAAARAEPALASASALPAFDYLAEPAQREAALVAWTAWWRALDKRRIPHPGPAVPLDAELNPIADTVHMLIASQDRTLVSIGE